MSYGFDFSDEDADKYEREVMDEVMSYMRLKNRISKILFDAVRKNG